MLSPTALCGLCGLRNWSMRRHMLHNVRSPTSKIMFLSPLPSKVFLDCDNFFKTCFFIHDTRYMYMTNHKYNYMLTIKKYLRPVRDKPKCDQRWISESAIEGFNYLGEMEGVLPEVDEWREPSRRKEWTESRSGGWHYRNHKCRDLNGSQKHEEWESYWNGKATGPNNLLPADV